MDAKLERVIELAKELQNAASDCACVLGCVYTAFPGVETRIHVYKPDTLGIPGLELYYTDDDGRDWVGVSINGVYICGRAGNE